MKHSNRLNKCYLRKRITDCTQTEYILTFHTSVRKYLLNSGSKLIRNLHFARWLFGLILFVVLLSSGFLNSAFATASVEGNWRFTSTDRIHLEVGGDYEYYQKYADITYNFGGSQSEWIGFTAADNFPSGRDSKFASTNNADFNSTTGSIVISLKHGVWRIAKERCETGTCYATARFIPNFTEIEKSILNKNQVIIVSLDFSIHTKPVKQKTFSIEFSDQEDITYLWYLSGEQELFANSDNTNHNTRYGRIRVQKPQLSLQYNAIEATGVNQQTTQVGRNTNNNHSYTITQTIWNMGNCRFQFMFWSSLPNGEIYS